MTNMTQLTTDHMIYDPLHSDSREHIVQLRFH